MNKMDITSMAEEIIPNKVDENELTFHSKKRMAQRNINKMMINICINFGEMILQETGSQVYYITDKIYNDMMNLKKCIERIKGLVVIVSEDGQLITTYKNSEIKRLDRNYRKN